MKSDRNGGQLPSAIIFGASTGGKRAYRYYKYKYKINAFLDNNKKLVGRKVYKKRIFLAGDYNFAGEEKVIIASSNSYEIYDQLINLGVMDPDIEFTHHEVLVGKYDWDLGAIGLIVFTIILTLGFLVYLVIQLLLSLI